MIKYLRAPIIMSLFALGGCEYILASAAVKQKDSVPEKPFVGEDEVWVPTILINITQQNEIWIADQAYDIDDIHPILQSLKNETPEATAIIIGDKEALASLVFEVQEVLMDLEIPTRLSTK